MKGYILRRTLATIPVLIVVSIVVFSFLHLAGGDPVQHMLGESGDPELIERVRADLGLDRPLIVQYLDWVGNAVTGDLGRSIMPARLSVTGQILQRLPVTAELAVLSVLIAVAFGVPLGILTAANRRKWWEPVLSNLANFGVAVPTFLLALLLVFVFGLWLRWLPTSGYVPISDGLADNLRYMVLPAVSLGAFLSAFVMRITKASMVDTLDREWVHTAKAKGLPRRRIIGVHGLKMGSLPIVTIVGLELGQMLAGSVIIETVFALPGLGKLVIDAIYARDMPMVQGPILFMTVCFVIINLAVDLLYGYLDPRVRYGRR
jgi:peptide/nickel transport system permease protein